MPDARARILITDDDPRVLTAYERALAPSGGPGGSFANLEAELFGDTPAVPAHAALELDACRQGEDAVDRVRAAVAANQPYAVAFVDVRMPPGMDGVEAAAAIRSLDEDIHIVIVTAWSDVAPSEIARRVPGNDRLLYLRKPWDPDEVRMLAGSLTERWRVERQLRQVHADLHAANERLAREDAELRQSEAALRRLHEELHTLADRALPEDPVEAVDAVAGVVRGALGLDGVRIVLEAPEGVIERHTSPDAPTTTGAGPSRLTRDAVTGIPDIDAEPDADALHVLAPDAAAVIVAPIRLGGRQVGLVLAEAAHPRRWRVEELSFCAAAAALLTRTVESGRRRSAERALRESEARHQRAVEGSRDGLWEWDLELHEVYMSPRWRERLGIPPGSTTLLAEDLLGRVLPADRARLREEFDHAIRTDAPVHVEHRLLNADGTWAWVLTRGTVFRDEDGRVRRLSGSMTDVSAYKRLEARLSDEANTDALTGLPNRRRMIARLDRVVSGPAAHPFAVLYLDIDRFKAINDSLGHGAGDRMLQEVANRLSDCVRPGDTVARVGGDEFVILLNDLHAPEDVLAVARRVDATLRQPIRVNEQDVVGRASMGIVHGPAEQRTAEEILRDADTAMYRAKAAPHLPFVVFDPSMHAQVLEALAMEAELRVAIDRDELHLAYQPIVRLQDQAVVGFEALARWTSPRLGNVSPVQFIPVAEQSGMIVPLGWRVLQSACREAAQWDGPVPPYVAVNVSYRQVVQPGFVTRLVALLGEVGLDPRRLKLEITESLVVETGSDAPQVLAALHALGIGLMLDDFGTGYSSLSYLQRFPVQAVKIDRSFVGNMLERSESMGIVRAVVSLARELNLNVVAEGIETAQQADTLRAIRCELGQGYHFAKPMPPEGARALLRRP